MSLIAMVTNLKKFFEFHECIEAGGAIFHASIGGWGCVKIIILFYFMNVLNLFLFLYHCINISSIVVLSDPNFNDFDSIETKSK